MPITRGPFETLLPLLAHDEKLQLTAIHVHDDLFIARDIAKSIFGETWEAHVLGVYDRLQTEFQRREKGEG